MKTICNFHTQIQKKKVSRTGRRYLKLKSLGNILQWFSEDKIKIILSLKQKIQIEIGI